MSESVYTFLVQCFLISLWFNSSWEVSISENSLPLIWLVGYTEVDSLQLAPTDTKFITEDYFQNDFISKNGSEYVVRDSVNKVAISCKALFPVTWAFPDAKKLPSTFFRTSNFLETRQSDFKPYMETPANLVYTSYIIIPIQRYKFFSANLTCQKAETSPPHQSSIYMYLDGKNDMENQGKTLQVSIVRQTQQTFTLTIPCRPSVPEKALLLEQQFQPGTPQEHWASFLEPWEFNPKTGFTLANARVDNLKYALYRCSVLNTDDNRDVGNKSNVKYVYVNVTYNLNSTQSGNNDDETSVPFRQTSILKHNAKVKIEQALLIQGRYLLYRPTIKCCSGVADKPATLYPHRCLTSLGCKLRKQHMSNAMENAKSKANLLKMLAPNLKLPALPKDSNGCVRRSLLYSYEIVNCQGENVNYVEEYTCLFRPESIGPVANRSLRLQNPAGQRGALTEYKSGISGISDIPLTQKMMVFVSRRVKDKNLMQSLKLGYPIIFDGGRKRGILYGGLITTDALREHVQKNSVYYVEYDRDVYYDGEPLSLLCVGVKIFYEKAAHLRLNWKNGTKSLLDQGKDDDITIPNHKLMQIFYLSGGDYLFSGKAIGTQYAFGKTVSADQDMSSIDCWMPVAGSVKWDKVSKMIQVLPSVAPRFLEPEDESVYLYMGDENMRVICTVVEAMPKAQIEVYRDGNQLQLKPHQMINATQKEDNSVTRINTQDFGIGEDKNTTRVEINFASVQYTNQGMIECIAKNVNSTVKRTVHIFVVDKPSVALPILGGVIALLCLVLAGIGYKQWHNRRLVQR